MSNEERVMGNIGEVSSKIQTSAREGNAYQRTANSKVWRRAGGIWFCRASHLREKRMIINGYIRGLSE